MFSRCNVHNLIYACNASMLISLKQKMLLRQMRMSIMCSLDKSKVLPDGACAR